MQLKSAFIVLVLGELVLARLEVKPSLHARALQDPTCIAIANAVSDVSEVYAQGQLHYDQGVEHWASSSEVNSNCVFEPGTPEDVARALHIIGERRAVFAVKGGGHSTNPGFSSTPGVQIAMSRFNEVDYHADEQTVTFGSGLTWDSVYEALAPYNVNVVGGRVSGVGVAGFTLGGGYSWKTNQYGLTIDTVVAFELVKPDGTILQVTEATQPDLFFGLRGGFNNFGIVTRFTLKTFPQTLVWGGLITYTASHIEAINEATAEFSATVTDSKASIITTYNYLLGAPGISQLLFYDGPTPPAGIFDKFLATPYFTKDVKTRDFLSLVRASPVDFVVSGRKIFHTVSVTTYTPNLLKAVQNESTYWGAQLSNDDLLNKLGIFLSYDVEPFLPNILQHGANSPSAYPYTRSTSYSPFNIYYSWIRRSNDGTFHNAIRQSAIQLTTVARAGGEDIEGAPLYGNYAIFTTPLESIYGSNLPRLRALKRLHDPENIMGLAGGWKL